MTDETKPETPPMPETTPPPAPVAEVAGDEGWSLGKRVGAWINTIVMILLAAGILVGVNYLSSRRFVRYDMTANQEYRINELTRTVLANLKRPIVLYTVMLNPEMTYEVWVAKDRLQDVLSEFKNSSMQVSLESLNYAMDEERLMAKAKDLNLKTQPTDWGVIVFDPATKRSKSIALSSMYEMDYSGGRTARIRSFNAEGLLVAAIKELTEDKPPVVYFAEGHGVTEGRTEPKQRGEEPGISWIVNRLKERENIETKTVNLIQAKEIPGDAKVLIIHRPGAKYGEAEVALLRDFLKRGGRLCVMTDPFDLTQGFVVTGLEGLLGEWGVKLGRNIVFSILRSPMGLHLERQPVIYGDRYGSHPIVDKLKANKVRCLMDLTRSVEKLEGAETRLEITPLMTLRDGAWGETSLEQLSEMKIKPDPEDLQGEIPIAMAVKATVPAEVSGAKISPESRLVVFGNAGFVSNALGPEGGNEDLFINALLWMVDREQGIGIGAKSIADRRVTLDEKAQSLFFWFCVVGLPVLTIVVGFGLWFVRRK
jgi:hypothetical protein